MASTFVAAVAILSFERSRPNRVSVGFGLSTVAVFVAELLLSIQLSSARSYVGGGQSLFEIYVLVGLVPLGLACTMFTLASMVSRGT